MSKSNVLAEAEANVIGEEIIIHGLVMRKVNGWWGEARITGYVEIHGKKYNFNKVVKVRFSEVSEDDL